MPDVEGLQLGMDFVNVRIQPVKNTNTNQRDLYHFRFLNSYFESEDIPGSGYPSGKLAKLCQDWTIPLARRDIPEAVPDMSLAAWERAVQAVQEAKQNLKDGLFYRELPQTHLEEIEKLEHKLYDVLVKCICDVERLPNLIHGIMRIRRKLMKNPQSLPLDGRVLWIHLIKDILNNYAHAWMPMKALFYKMMAMAVARGHIVEVPSVLCWHQPYWCQLLHEEDQMMGA